VSLLCAITHTRSDHFPRAAALRGYIEAARMIPLRVDPFINLERVFFAGVPEALSSEDGTREDK
jgi:hypothetical protein